VEDVVGVEVDVGVELKMTLMCIELARFGYCRNKPIVSCDAMPV
jgi:hypothetical protein